MELIKPQRYKHTDIGTIPDEWEVKRMGDIGESIIGLTYSPSDVKEYGTLVLRSSNIQNNKLAYQDNVYVEMDLPKRVIVRENDILICVRNGSRQLIGKCAIIDKKAAGSAFGAFMSIYRSPFSKFVFHQFQSHVVQRQISETMGATINQLTNKDLACFQIPLPPTTEEQAAITTILCDTDALITGLENLIEKKRLIKQGSMQQLLRPKKDWSKMRIGMFTKVVAGGTPGTAMQEYWGGDIRWMSSGELHLKNVFDVEKRITQLGYENSSTQLIPTRCVLIGLAGQGKTRGTVAINQVELCTNQSIAAIYPNDKVLSEFLYFYLDIRYDELRSLSTGDGGRGGLNVGIIKNIEISFPSLQRQKVIANILEDIDAEITSLERKLAKYKGIKQGMMQMLLTGRVRLIELATTNHLIPLTTQPVKKTTGHNVQFNEAVLISVLAGRYGNTKFPLGRFRYTKFLYLFHRHVEGAANGYLKKAAGPYNPSNRYGGPEGIAVKNRYVQQVENKGYVAADNIDEAKRYFGNWYHDDALTWLDQFRYYKNDQLELLTTVDMAVDDLRKEGKAIDVAGVKAVIAGNKEWKAKLKKPFFNDIGIAGAIKQSNELFP